MSNFFTQMKSVIGEAEVQINIKIKGDLVTAMVMPKTSANDPAMQKIEPLVLTATAEELDEGFFSAISSPLARVTGLMSNVEQFERAAAEADKESKIKKAAETKTQAKAEVEKNKFEALMKKAEGFFASKKDDQGLDFLRQALAIKPDDNKLKKRIGDLESKLSKQSLFSLEPMDKDDSVETTIGEEEE